MSITDTTPRVQYTASASQTTFTYAFRIDQQADIKVYQTPVANSPSDSADILVLNTDYTVTGAGTDAGGTIVLTTGATNGDILTLVRDMPLARISQYNTGAKLSSDDLNNDLNSIILMGQQLEMKIDEMSLNYDFTFQSAQKDRDLPLLTASQFWQKNSLNTGIIAADMEESAGWSTLRTELASETQLAPGAALIGYYDNIFGGTTLNDELNTRLPPTDDNIAIIKNATDTSKRIKFDASGITTATTRTITMPDADVTLGALVKANDAEILAGTDDVKYFSTKGWHDTSTIILQRVSTLDGEVATGSTTMPYTDNIPQITEGDEYMTVTITPKRTDSNLLIQVIACGSASQTQKNLTVALFRDATANALGATSLWSQDSTREETFNLTVITSSSALTASTFRVRLGSDHLSSVFTFNGSASNRIFGGVSGSSIIVTEYI